MEHKSGSDPRIAALPDIHGHAKGEHKPYAEERPIPYTARMLFLWFFHACRRNSPRFVMVADHMNYLTFEDPAAVNLVRRALKLAQAGDLYGAAETAGVELGHAAVVSEGLRRGMRYSIGAEIDNDPRCRPDAQNIVDAMKPDGMIRSVHFLPITHPTHGENWMWPFDNPEFKDLYDIVGTESVWEIYIATLLDAIDKLPGHIVGHFYVPAKFGHWPADDVLEGYEDRFLTACAERGMAIEVNSRYFYKYFLDDDAQRTKYRDAHLRLLRKAKERGVMVAVGSDAHSPKDQGGAFDTVLALLDEAEINEIAFPLGGRLARVALRATEEILREHSAALAAPAERIAARAAAAMHAPIPDEDTDSDDDEAAEGDAAPKPELLETPTLTAEPIAATTVVAVAAEASESRTPAKKRPPKKIATVVEAVAATAERAVEAVTAVFHPEPSAPIPSAEIAKPKPSKTEPEPHEARTSTETTAPEAKATSTRVKSPAVAAEPIAASAVAAKVAAPKVVEPNPSAGKTSSAKAVAAKPPAAKSSVPKAIAKPVATKATPAKPAPKSAAPKSPAKVAASKTAPKAAKPKAPVVKAKAKSGRTAAKPTVKPVAKAKAALKAPARTAAPAKKTATKPVANKTAVKPARATGKSAPAAKKAAKPVSRSTKAKPPIKKAAAKKAVPKKVAAMRPAAKKAAAKKTVPKKTARARR